MKETFTIEFETSFPNGAPTHKFEEDEITIQLTGNPNGTARVVAEVRGTGGKTLTMIVAMLPSTFAWADKPLFASFDGLERWGLQSFDKHVQRIMLSHATDMKKLVLRLIVGAKEFDLECLEGRAEELRKLATQAEQALLRLKEVKV